MKEETNKAILDNTAIGNRIRLGREALDLTRDQLAELLAISSYYLGQLERGERQMSLPVLVKVSKTLHVSLDYLILGSNPSETPDLSEAESLLKKCTKNELELVKKLIKTVLPYTK